MVTIIRVRVGTLWNFTLVLSIAEVHTKLNHHYHLQILWGRVCLLMITSILKVSFTMPIAKTKGEQVERSKPNIAHTSKIK